MISMEKYIEKIFPAAALVSAAVTLMIFGLMVVSGLPLFAGKNSITFFTGPWSPLSGQYGIYQMIAGSVVISLLALCLGFPVCLGYTALMTLYAPKRVRNLLRRIIILMSGVPTVIYGFVGIFLLVPLVREIFDYGSGLCVLSAALLLVLLIAPTMILMFHGSFESVPKKHLLAIDALGGTKGDKLLYGYIPGAWRGIVSGLLLGFGRALGDTLIVLMVAGNAVSVPSSLLDGARTLTSHIALVFAADFESSEFRAIFACGLTLYLITTILSLGVRSMTRSLVKVRA